MYTLETFIKITLVPGITSTWSMLYLPELIELYWCIPLLQGKM